MKFAYIIVYAYLSQLELALSIIYWKSSSVILSPGYYEIH